MYLPQYHSYFTTMYIYYMYSCTHVHTCRFTFLNSSSLCDLRIPPSTPRTATPPFPYRHSIYCHTCILPYCHTSLFHSQFTPCHILFPYWHIPIPILPYLHFYTAILAFFVPLNCSIDTFHIFICNNIILPYPHSHTAIPTFFVSSDGHQ